MTCDDVRRSIPLMQYSEISFEDEERVHAHLSECAACRQEYERERTLHRVLDERELDVSPFFLRGCRDQFAEALEKERRHGGRYRSWWAGLISAFNGSGWVPVVVKPAGAVALVALGFFAAHMGPLSNLGVQSAGLGVDPANARVRYVEPSPQGGVQLVVDETRQRVITGHLDDERIRALLLSAAKDPTDPGLRVESVDILKNRSESDEIRNALVYALQHDSNDGVRLKALEGLKLYASQPEVRKALSQALLTDSNPGLRAQAIDLLTQNSNEEHVVGVLQELMHTERNGYIRLRCEKALRQMKASVETY
jgi:hypothetical protein